MADNHSSDVRGKNMFHVRSRNTKEEIVKKYFFSKSFRYRKNVRTAPGCSDIVLSKYRTSGTNMIALDLYGLHLMRFIGFLKSNECGTR